MYVNRVGAKNLEVFKKSTRIVKKTQKNSKNEGSHQCGFALVSFYMYDGHVINLG